MGLCASGAHPPTRYVLAQSVEAARRRPSRRRRSSDKRAGEREGRRRKSSGKIAAGPAPAPALQREGSRPELLVGAEGDQGGDGRSLAWIQREPLPQQRLCAASVKLVSCIGAGLTSTVHLSSLTADPAKWLVVKRQRKDKLLRKNEVRHARWERDALRALADCPFVVHLLGTFQTPQFVCFCLEYVPGGEMFSLLRRTGRLALDEAKFYACELLVALEATHRAGFAYRDLKPENVLLDDEGHVRLADFGFARPPDEHGKCYTGLGTPAYTSPELLDARAAHEGYTKAVDWWSYGVVLYEMLTAKTPFARAHDDTAYEVYGRIIEGKVNFRRGFDPAARHLIESLLAPDRAVRLTEPGKIRAHAFFDDVPWKALASRCVRPPVAPQVLFAGDGHNFERFECTDGDAEHVGAAPELRGF